MESCNWWERKLIIYDGMMPFPVITSSTDHKYVAICHDP